MRELVYSRKFKDSRCFNYDLFFDAKSYMIILKYDGFSGPACERPYTISSGNVFLTNNKEHFDRRSYDIKEWKNYTQECVK